MSDKEPLCAGRICGCSREIYSISASWPKWLHANHPTRCLMKQVECLLLILRTTGHLNKKAARIRRAPQGTLPLVFMKCCDAGNTATNFLTARPHIEQVVNNQNNCFVRDWLGVKSKLLPTVPQHLSAPCASNYTFQR